MIPGGHRDNSFGGLGQNRSDHARHEPAMVPHVQAEHHDLGFQFRSERKCLFKAYCLVENLNKWERGLCALGISRDLKPWHLPGVFTVRDGKVQPSSFWQEAHPAKLAYVKG
jgi:hypothetical protein